MNMKEYSREQISTLCARLNEDPTHLIIVTGPRQTGKTTLVTQALTRLDKPYRYFAVDEPEAEAIPPFFSIENENITTSSNMYTSRSVARDKRWLVRCWEQARLESLGSKQGLVLVFDEIQCIPDWSTTVKGLWDADRHSGVQLHVVLLGSAPLLMRKGTHESLLGRFETIYLSHWSFDEMSVAFDIDLDRYLYFGGIPGSASLIGDQSRWREYVRSAVVEPNLERDVLAIQRVDKPIILKRLFELGAVYSGQILSYNKMLGQLQDAGNTTTLAHYLDLLGSAGLMIGIQKYAQGTIHRRASSPKLNVLNTAFMSAYSGYTFEEAKSDRSYWGRLVESAVGAHLINSGFPEIRVHYWRHRGFEVDFVLERGKKIVAVEVKSGASSLGKLSGLSEFSSQFQSANTLIVGKNGVGLSEFFTTPASEWFK